MKKILPLLLVVVAGVMFVSAQDFNVNVSACVSTVVAGVAVCLCGGTAASMSCCTAGGMGNGGPLLQFLNLAQTIVNRLVPFLIGLALVVFFWYLIQYIWKGDESPEKRQEGLRGMGYSILAIFVMVAIWGIIALIGSVTGIGIGGGLPALEMPRVK
jgi:hypothetical protein